ncbi:hypothetical protein V502_08957 [Pseudogymnoascus sp. VKM F-4520 (FW-2644)]|nr:hypothetical protein V502_08957 [Pseudogymnoascus sp. VKM F-4520 (FW-2644)]
MHFFSVVAACLLCSSLAAAGPLPRDRPRKLQFRQVAPYKNTTSTTDSVAATIEVIPISLTETPVSTATATTIPTTEISTKLSTSSTATTFSTSAFSNTTLPSASTATTSAGDVPITSSTIPTATAAGDGSNAAQTAIGASQTTKLPISSSLSGYVSSGSIVQGTGNFSRTVVSTNSTATGTQVFPFAETLTTTPGAISTTSGVPFTFSSDPVTPTTLSTRTTNPPVAITVSGVGAAVPITPSFFTSASPLPTTTDAPTTTTSDVPIIEVPTKITGAITSVTPTASLAAVVAKNLELATYYNDLFPTLTPNLRCAPNSIACIDGSLATCVDGSYVLQGCTKGTACYALPLPHSEGVSVYCANIETAERILGLPNSLSVTIGSVPVVVPSTTAEVAQATSVIDPGPTTTTAEAAVTAAAVQSSNSGGGETQAEEETTVLHTTLVSTITIAVSDFAPSTVVAAATTVAAADGSLISVVPVAAAAAGGSGNAEEVGTDGLVTVTVTRSVTVTEQFTVTRAGVTATVTA